MARAKGNPEKEISVMKIQQGAVTFCIVGTTPLIINCMSEKALHELLLPQGRKTAADKQQNLKHAPLEEYRNSVYRRRTDDGPTRLIFPSTAFKGAMMTAALDLPGTKKAQIGRLVYVEGQFVDLFGAPQMFMSVVRSADMNRTPDVRTRAILPEWACRVRIRYNASMFKPQALGNLLAAAGIFCGVGDFRQEKGKGNYGQFAIVNEDDPTYLRIAEAGGRGAQDDALKNPAPYDVETEKLFGWYTSAVLERHAGGSEAA